MSTKWPCSQSVTILKTRFLYRKWDIFGIMKVLFYRAFSFFFIFLKKSFPIRSFKTESYFKFNPELIIISSGYDACIGCFEVSKFYLLSFIKMKVTPACYAHLINCLSALSQCWDCFKKNKNEKKWDLYS